jgi:hypothetical protein
VIVSPDRFKVITAPLQGCKGSKRNPSPVQETDMFKVIVSHVDSNEYPPCFKNEKV